MVAIKDLKAGYKRFYSKYFTRDDRLFKFLNKYGQSPKTLIIACSDSRTDPSIITNSKPGDFLAIRNVANLVPPYEQDKETRHGVSAALEFGVKVIGIENIIILGHSNCAGIRTVMEPETVKGSDFIESWVSMAEPAKQKVLKENPNCDPAILQHKCEKETILCSLANLMTFPWIKDRVDQGKLELHGWYFTLKSGTLEHFNPKTGQFERIRK